MQNSRPDRSSSFLVQDGNAIEIGSLRLDPDGYTASVDGRDVALTMGEFLILREFAQNPYLVLRRERLAALIHAGTGGSDALVPSPRSVDTHIARLRAKLRQAGYDCIKTMRFVGYRFVPSPEQDSHSSP